LQPVTKLSGIFRVNAAERDLLAVYNLYVDAGIERMFLYVTTNCASTYFQKNAERIEFDERKLDGHIVAGSFVLLFCWIAS